MGDPDKKQRHRRAGVEPALGARCPEESHARAERVLADLDAVIDALPAMREPTVATLHGGAGMAVKAAVPRRDLPRLIPRLRQLGATDIAVSKLEQIVP